MGDVAGIERRVHISPNGILIGPIDLDKRGFAWWTHLPVDGEEMRDMFGIHGSSAVERQVGKRTVHLIQVEVDGEVMETCFDPRDFGTVLLPDVVQQELVDAA
jgi:hypothetical protein